MRTSLISGLETNVPSSNSSIRFEVIKVKVLLYSIQNEIAEYLRDSIISVTEEDTKNDSH
ncbi:MAG: hypothetical protein ACJAQ2_001965 [Vicingaceae bacterium]